MLRRILWGCVVFAAGTCLAADRYVAPNGNDVGNNCTNINSPCRTPIRCFNVMSPGETCYLRGGTYNAPNTTDGGSSNGAGYDFGGPTSPTYGGCDGVESRCLCDSGNARCKGGTSASAMKILSGYAGETAVIYPETPERYVMSMRQDGGSNLGNGSWVRLKNMTIYGRIGVWGGNVGFEATQVVFTCPGGQADGNISNIFSLKTGEHDTNSMHLWNNLFLHTAECNARYAQIRMSCSENHDHLCSTADNMPGPSSDCSGTCSYNAPPSWIHMYDLNGALIENNDFLITTTVTKHGANGFAQGFGLKEGNQNCVFRYNYLAATNGGSVGQQIWMLNNRYNGSAAGNKNFQNIVIGGGAGMYSSGNNYNGWTQGWDLFYNNTIIGSDVCMGSNVDGIVEQQQVFNNICHNTDRYIDWNTTTGHKVGGQAYWDNNNYYPAGVSSSFRDNHAGSTSHSSLASWKGSSGAGAGMEQQSREVNPLFRGANDYRLQSSSPLLTGGRGGSYPTVLGAYVTGTETIGCTFDPRCHAFGGGQTGGGTAPPNVTGVRRTDSHP